MELILFIPQDSRIIFANGLQTDSTNLRQVGARNEFLPLIHQLCLSIIAISHRALVREYIKTLTLKEITFSSSFCQNPPN